MDRVLVALVPVIHTGYIDLFKKYSDKIFILGEDILEEWSHNVHLHRDLRRLDQKEIVKLIKSLDFVKEVNILNKENIKELENNIIVMPNEDVSHWFSEKYFNNENVEFVNHFLRWNKPVSTTEMEVPPDRTVTEDQIHKELIFQAQKVSEKSANWWRQIGTLAVKNGEVIAQSYNKHVPTQYNIEVYGDLRSDFNAGEHHELSNSIHGEASLIANCAKKGVSLEGADLYVTTFPCPTCAKLVSESGIKRVFYKDGYSLADAEDILKNAGVEIILVK